MKVKKLQDLTVSICLFAVKNGLLGSKKETQKEHTYTADGLINGGGHISGWSYIWIIFVGKLMGLSDPGGGLKTGGL